jgi:uncharacterized Zn ribbon protein
MDCVEKHVNKTTLTSQKMVNCPNCNFEFSLTYARAIACQGCPMSVSGCENVRCPNCDSEFTMQDANITTSMAAQKYMGKHISKVLSQYYNEFGESAGR